MQNSFSPQDTLGKSLNASYLSPFKQTDTSLNLSGTWENTHKLVATEEVLKKLVSVCLIANLVVNKIEYGSELLKRLLETKVRKSDLIWYN